MGVTLWLIVFLSTLSVRRATALKLIRNLLKNISIHALREESDLGIGGSVVHICISIHALREESDMVGTNAAWLYYISIHALREESDLSISSP